MNILSVFTFKKTESFFNLLTINLAPTSPLIFLNLFKKIKGDVGAKFMVKRLKKDSVFLNVKTDKIFKDFDRLSDF